MPVLQESFKKAILHGQPEQCSAVNNAHGCDKCDGSAHSKGDRWSYLRNAGTKAFCAAAAAPCATSAPTGEHCPANKNILLLNGLPSFFCVVGDFPTRVFKQDGPSAAAARVTRVERLLEQARREREAAEHAVRARARAHEPDFYLR